MLCVRLTIVLMLQGLQNNTDSPQLMYALYGVVEHSGTLRSGHYTAYVKLRSSDTAASQCLEFLQTLSPSQICVDELVTKLRSISLCSKHQPSYDSESESTGLTGEKLHSHTSLTSDGRWFHISDTSVSQVKLANVLRCQAYILFYERIS